MRHLLVRADADSRIGLGHVLRTMAVVDELARTGAQVTYVSRKLSPWAKSQLELRGFNTVALEMPEPSDEVRDAEETVRALGACGADAILVDHYGLTQVWTEHLKARTGLVLAAFDDLAQDKRSVDLLIDASPGRSAADYETLIPTGAVCLAGPRYAPLRPEFSLAAKCAPATGPMRVAIAMGGVDPSGVTLTCLDALDGQTDITVTVILSSDAKMLGAIKERVARMATPTRLLLDRTDMAALLTDIDLVIGAGGTSALERCALGVPSVIAVLAENQANNAAQLAEAGAAVVLPNLSAQTIFETTQTILSEPEKLIEMGQHARRVCDGLGAARIASKLLAVSSQVSLRPAEPSDKVTVFEWQCAPGARRFSRNPNAPSYDEHDRWFTRRLARADHDPFYIIEAGGVPSGFVRLDAVPSGEWEVSILVTETMQGRGLARTALGLLRLAHPKLSFVAEVAPENAASQKLFAQAGYRRIDDTSFTSQGWAEIAKGQHDGH